MLSLALKLLLRKIDRTAITILMLVPVIALLIGSNLLVVGYVHTAQSSINILQSNSNNSNKAGKYLAYISSNNNNSSSGVGGVLSFSFANSLSYNSFLQINGSEGVSQAVPYLLLENGQALVNSKNYSVSIAATNMQSFVSARSPLVYGKMPSQEDQITIGTILAKMLGVQVGDKIGLELFSQAHNFSISSIFNSTSQYDTMLMLPLSSIWSIWPQTNQSISYVEFEATALSANALQSEAGLPRGLTVMNEQSLGQVLSSFSEETANLVTLWTYVLLGLSVAVAVVASSRVVSGTALEYGVLRTLGAKISSARRLLAYEHLIVCGISVVLGVAAGIVITDILSTVLSSVLGTPIAPVVDLAEIAILGAASLSLVFASGLVAIFRLPRMTTIERAAVGTGRGGGS